MSGTIIFCLDSAKTSAALIVYSIFVGLWSAVISSIGTTAITLCTKDPRHGAYLGQGLAFGAIATLIGPPVSGRLIAVYGGVSQVSFDSVVTVAGGLVAVGTKPTTPQGILG